MSTIDPVSVVQIKDPEIRSVLEKFKEIINFLVEHRVNDAIVSSIGAGTGTVKMTSGNNANNSRWIPIQYEGSTFWVPAWTTNSP